MSLDDLFPPPQPTAKEHKPDSLTDIRKAKILADLRLRIDSDYEAINEVRAEAKGEFEKLRMAIDQYEKKIYKTLEDWTNANDEQFHTLIQQIDEAKDEGVLLDLLETAEVELSFREEKSILSQVDKVCIEDYVKIETAKGFVPFAFTQRNLFEHCADNGDEVIRPTRKLTKLKEYAAKHGFRNELTANGSYSEYVTSKKQFVDCSRQNSDSFLLATKSDTPYIANIMASFVCEEYRYDWKEAIRFRSNDWGKEIKWRESKFFSVDSKSPMVVTRTAGVLLNGGIPSIELDFVLPKDKEVSWGIKLLKLTEGSVIQFGVKIKSDREDDGEDDSAKSVKKEGGGLFDAIIPTNGGGLFDHSLTATSPTTASIFDNVPQGGLFSVAPPQGGLFSKDRSKQQKHRKEHQQAQQAQQAQQQQQQQREGWCFDCYTSKTIYQPSKNPNESKEGRGNRFFAGSIVNVTMDMSRGTLSFCSDKRNIGFLQEIPVDKPLVPCVYIADEGDSVEIISITKK